GPSGDVHAQAAITGRRGLGHHEASSVLLAQLVADGEAVLAQQLTVADLAKQVSTCAGLGRQLAQHLRVDVITIAAEQQRSDAETNPARVRIADSDRVD